MRLRLSSRSLRNHLLSASLLLATTLASAGQFSGEIGYDVYKDFAHNRGQFAAGATNVPIYKQDGSYVGTIDLVPDFSGMLDLRAGSGSLVGGQNWAATAAHDYDMSVISFSKKYGAEIGSVYYDNYVSLQNVKAGFNTEDLSVSRLNKLVTDAVAWDYCTDPDYISNDADNVDPNSPLAQATYMRIGSGFQMQINADGSTEIVDQAYWALTAGEIQFRDVVVSSFGEDEGYGVHEFFHYSFTAPEPSVGNALPISVTSGDSGSPLLVYNANTERWEFLGCATTSALNYGWDDKAGIIASPTWMAAVHDSTKVQISSADVSTWTVTRAADGMLTFSNEIGNSINAEALADGLRGYTSDRSGTTLAGNSVMFQTKDWVFGEGGVTVDIQSNIDTGAGALLFTQSGEGVTQYDLMSSNGSFLNSAGYQIEEGVYVKTTLTGAQGDEWRVVGAWGTGGTLEIAGSGQNFADLNVGVGARVILNRGNTVNIINLKINTKAYVQMNGSNQIAGQIVFGAGGGVLDINGNNLIKHELYALTSDATMANFGSTDAAFTFTGIGLQSYIGSFADGTSTNKSEGKLSLNYNASSSSTWRLSGYSDIGGDVNVNNGKMSIGGVISEGGYYQKIEEKWTYVTPWINAVFKANTFHVASTGQLELAYASHVNAHINLNQGSRFYALNGSMYTGNMSVSGTANIDRGALISGNIIVNNNGILNLNEVSSMNAGLTLNGATLNIEYGSNFDLSTTQGISLESFTATGSNALNIYTSYAIESGKYLLFETGGASVNTAGITLGGHVSSGGDSRQIASLITEGNNVYLNLEGSNATLTWTGNSGAIWDLKNTVSWSGAADNDNRFYMNDVATFNNATHVNQVVGLNSSLTPKRIEVKAGSYVFQNVSSDYDNPAEITGSSSIHVSGGALTLELANTYTNGTFISGGTLTVTRSHALGTGDIHLTGGELIMRGQYGSIDLSQIENIYLSGGSLSFQNTSLGIYGDYSKGIIHATGESTIYALGGSNMLGQLNVSKDASVTLTGGGNLSGFFQVEGKLILDGMGQTGIIRLYENSVLHLKAGTSNEANIVAVQSGLSSIIEGGGSLNNALIAEGGGILRVGEGAFTISGYSNLMLNDNSYLKSTNEDARVITANTSIQNNVTIGEYGTGAITLNGNVDTTGTRLNVESDLNITGSYTVVGFISEHELLISNNVKAFINQFNIENPSTRLYIGGKNDLANVGGMLVVNALSALNTGTHFVNNGAAVGFNTTGVLSSVAHLQTSSTGYIGKVGEGTLSITAQLSNGSHGGKMGTVVEGGTLHLSNINNTHSGDNLVRGGTLTIAAAGSLGTGKVIMTGGQFDMGGFSVSNDISYTSGTLKDYGSYTGTISTINGSDGAQNKLSLSNEYSGGLNISSGFEVTLTGSLSNNEFSLSSLNGSGSLVFDFGSQSLTEGTYTLLSTTGDLNWSSSQLRLLATNLAGFDADWNINGKSISLTLTLGELGHVKIDQKAQSDINYFAIDSTATLTVEAGTTSHLNNTKSEEKVQVDGIVHAEAGSNILIGDSGAEIATTAQVKATGLGGSITLHSGSINAETELQASATNGADLKSFSGTAKIDVEGQANIIQDSNLTLNTIQVDASSDLLLKNVIVGADTNISLNGQLKLDEKITIEGASSRTLPSTLSLEENTPTIQLDFKVGSADAMSFTAGESLELVLDFTTIVGDDWAQLLTFLRDNPNTEVNFSFAILGLEYQDNISMAQIDIHDYIITLGTQNWQDGNMTATIMYIPEPGTVSMSLLALAGLAARRRRKA